MRTINGSYLSMDTPVSMMANNPESVYRYNGNAKAQKYVFSGFTRLTAKGFLQLLFILSGSGKITVNGTDSQIRQSTIVTVDAEHTVELHPASPVIIYSCSFLPSLFGLENKGSCSFLSLAELPELSFFFAGYRKEMCLFRLPRSRTEAFQKLFNEMMAETESPTRAYDVIQRLKVTEVLVRLAETFDSEWADSLSDEQIVRQVTAYINENYQSKLTYDELAALCCVSKSKLYSAFKTVTDNTIGKYIETVRMEHACTLLLETDETVFNIMLGVGYNDMKMFCKRFKELTSYTPGSYRKQK